MSREQWGHGYHKGVEDAKKCKGDYKYFVFYDNGEEPEEPPTSHRVYRIVEKVAEQVMLVEDISECFNTLLFMLTGGWMYCFGISEDAEVDDNHLLETTEEELTGEMKTNGFENVRKFVTAKGTEAFVISLINNWCEWNCKREKTKEMEVKNELC